MAIIISNTQNTLSKKPTYGKTDDKINVGVDFKTIHDSAGSKVKMATHAQSSSSKNDFSLSSSTRIKPGPDELNLAIGVGDWARDPGDRDAFDFLICISGAKGAGGPLKPIKNMGDIDLMVDLNLSKGMTVEFKPESVKGLKLVKCKDADGNPAWGYAGKVSDARKLKLELKSEKTGKKLANMNIDLSKEDDDDDHPIKFPFDFDKLDPLGSL